MLKNLNLHKFSLLTLSISALFFLTSCGDDGPTKSKAGTSVLKGTVYDISDTSIISKANVIVYNAQTNAPVTRELTDADGDYKFELETDAYYVKIAAQGYIPSPPESGAPIPFQLNDDPDVLNKDWYMSPDPSAAGTGSISGKVKNSGSDGMTGFLITAANQAGTKTFSGSSGPDGYYVLYNLEPGTYSLYALYAGYNQQAAPLQVTVTANTAQTDQDITIENIKGTSLSGQITFLASPNSIVDITLVDLNSQDAIPGLSTYNNTNNAYALDSVPPGSFITWASYQNDGYVMDPDWIRKSGLPTLEVTNTTGSASKDFSVTGAIPLISPTNPADSIYAVAVNTTTPVFRWEDYPSSKEFIIEVRDKNGNRIWGGYQDSIILHEQIPSSKRSVTFDFDGSASGPLKNGGTYQWKVYADGDADPDIQKLISSSEDLLGIFTVVIDTSGN